MKNYHQARIILWATLLLASCQPKEPAFDATGTFEAEEIIVSAEVAGKILEFDVQEGDQLPKDSVVAILDAGNLALQKVQIQSSLQSLQEKTNNVLPSLQLLRNQLAVQAAQLAYLQKEQQRFTALVKADAATPKQVDDLTSQIEVLERQMDVTKQQMKVQENNTATANRSIMSEQDPLAKKAAIIADQIDRSKVKNPINGTVLSKYAYAGEIVGAGKGLYKIANISTLLLRAYVTGDQLSQIKLNQPVDIYVDKGKKDYTQHKGKIIWIAANAEFTPKTIQTKDERANLVYAVKILVPNDGYLKIGQYGEVKWSK